jgi:hypothetical protein
MYDLYTSSLKKSKAQVPVLFEQKLHTTLGMDKQPSSSPKCFATTGAIPCTNKELEDTDFPMANKHKNQPHG